MLTKIHVPSVESFKKWKVIMSAEAERPAVIFEFCHGVTSAVVSHEARIIVM